MKKFIYLTILFTAHHAMLAQWELVYEITAEQNNFSGMSVTNDSTAFIGINIYDNWPQYRACILKTTDYAITWDTVYSITTNVDGYFEFRDIFFINENIGWACGSPMPYILKTTDGGSTWVEQPIAGAQNFNKIEFYDSSFGIALYGGDAIYTTDGGENWLLRDSLIGYDIDFLDECYFIINDASYLKTMFNCDLEYQIFPTSEDGNNPERNGRAIHMINENTWVTTAVGLVGFNNFGSIIRTTDGGQSFQFLDLYFTNNASSLHFYDDLNGYVSLSSTNVGNPPCAIMKTSDGGITWFCQETPIIEYLGSYYNIGFSDIECPTPEICYASNGNRIFRTFNGGGPLGEMWTAVEEPKAKMNEFSVYPNPVHDILSLNIENLYSNRTVQVNIFDAVGQLFIKESSNNNKVIEMNIADLASGTYYIQVISDQTLSAVAFVKQ